MPPVGRRGSLAATTGATPPFRLARPLGRIGLTIRSPPWLSPLAPSALSVRFFFVRFFLVSHGFFAGSFEALSLGDTGTSFTEESLEYVEDERSEEERVMDAASLQLASVLATEYSEMVSAAGGDAMRETLVGGIVGVRDGRVTEELVEYARGVILSGEWEGSSD
jgi:hypothetical protein